MMYRSVIHADVVLRWLPKTRRERPKRKRRSSNSHALFMIGPRHYKVGTLC